VPEQIRRYYANLELPVGATADEVKSAYRRLIRRYHPDRHREPSAQRAAAELARELRNAYEGLLRFLEDRQRPTGT
jgi:curved DNA-binding protein CbpA